MHKLNLASRLSVSSLFCLSLTLAVPSPSQAKVEVQSGKAQPAVTAPSTQELLPVNLAENWRATGPEQTLNSNQWTVLPDAEVYAEYGLEKLTSRVYSDGKNRITVEAFAMKYTSGAFGLFTFNRSALPRNRREFYFGRYLVSLAYESSDPGADQNNAASEASLIESLKKALPTISDQFPTLPSHLPEENKIPGSEKYIVGPVVLARLKNLSDVKELIKFGDGAEIAVGDYQNGSEKMTVVIVEHNTPQIATDGYARLTRYYESLEPSQKQKRIIKRIGNYLVMAINLGDQPAAEKILSKIKYTPQIYWEGKTLSDVPVAYRQPDNTAIEEATKTIKVIVGSFVWIVVMLISSILLGLIFGGALFYYKRHRRRKLGIDDLFADTGETVRLNLDDYLLQPDEPAVKQLGDGKH